MAAICAAAGLVFHLLVDHHYDDALAHWRSALATAVAVTTVVFVLGVELRRWHWALGFALLWGVVLGLIASLSAGLLARKGGARPAMRRQPLGSGPAPLGATGYDDLGWNDMGYDVDPDQSGEPARMLDLKPLLTGSVLAHNVEAEHAVDDSVGHELTGAVAEEYSAEDFGAAAFEAEAAEVPEIVRQQKSLIDRVAAVARKVEARPAETAKKAKAPRALRAREKAAFTLRPDAVFE